MLLWLSIACPKIDQQPQLRSEKEQARLQADATEYWNSLRWGIPQRSAAFIEDPLARARFAADPPSGELLDVKVLAAQLDPRPEEASELAPSASGAEVWQTATVVVRIEAIDPDRVLRVREHNQQWYRTEAGWFVEVAPEQMAPKPEQPAVSQ